MCNATQGNLGGSRRIGHRQICPWNLFCDKLGSGIFFATNWAPESFFAKNWAPESFLRQIEPAIFFATNCTPESFLQIGPGKIGRRQNEPWLIGPRQIIGSRMSKIIFLSVQY